MSINSLMNVAKDALISYQMAIDVTGANIANVNTPGYSRQRAVLNSVGVVQVDSQIVQLGVEVVAVERIYNAYTEAQTVEQAGMVGYSEARMDTIDRVETIFNETGDGGLNDLLSQFWDAWDSVSGNPGGQAERDKLLAVSGNLVSVFNAVSSDLMQIQQDTDKTIKATIDC
jgi:flagellar hook-associated protein 1 FlgK